ncbi:MAG: flotillin-like FloA family protein [Planctomycetes bacterium]|nr:flotillin-like FloA family protein [Planctomycetota bacterium]
MTTAGLVLAQDTSRTELDFTVIFLVSIFAGLLTFLVQALPAVWYWLKAQAIGAPVGFFRLAVMRLRREPIARILRIHAAARQAGLRIEIQRWEEHWMARGNLELLL